MTESKVKYVLLDFDNNPIRYFDYPANNTEKIVEKQMTYDELHKLLGDCLI